MRTLCKEQPRVRDRCLSAMRGRGWQDYREFVPDDYGHPGAPSYGKLVRREEWGAAPALRSDGRLSLPIMYVNTVSVFMETEDGELEEGLKGAEAVRRFQQVDMSGGMADIRSNFIIDEDGLIYEGRGWEQKPAITKEDNPTKYMEYLEICYIGDFSEAPLDHPIHISTSDLMSVGIGIGVISDKAVLIAPLGPLDNFTENFLDKYPLPERKYLAPAEEERNN